MATANSKQRAAAPTNIVRLPTAAPRRVKQSWNRANREAAFQLREETAWPIRLKEPWTMEAEKVALAIVDAERTPALRIAVAILEAMDTAQRVAIVAKLGERAAAGGNAFAAFQIARLTGPITAGEACDIKRALAEIDGRD